jgi:hypothetical protein
MTNRRVSEMSEDAGNGSRQIQVATKAKWLRVRVVDTTKGDHPSVNVKVPIGVAKWGMRMATKFSPQAKDLELDWDSITAMIDEGADGKIVEVEDDAEHKTIEVWVE